MCIRDSLKTTPDIDNNSVKVEVAANTTSADKVEVKVFDGKNLVAKGDVYKRKQ